MSTQNKKNWGSMPSLTEWVHENVGLASYFEENYICNWDMDVEDPVISYRSGKNDCNDLEPYQGMITIVSSATDTEKKAISSHKHRSIKIVICDEIYDGYNKNIGESMEKCECGNVAMEKRKCVDCGGPICQECYEMSSINKEEMFKWVHPGCEINCEPEKVKCECGNPVEGSHVCFHCKTPICNECLVVMVGVSYHMMCYDLGEV